MDYPVWGILTVLFSSGAFILSVYYQRRDSYAPAIWLLMLGGLMLRLFTACDFFLHPWDEVYHAVVAKHMMQHPLTPMLYETPVLTYDYTNWTGNHIWLHKQPLPLWSMALSMSLFGINEIALRLPSILLTTIGIFLTYYIGTYFFDRRTGYLAAFFYAINGLIIEMTAGRVATDHIDVFFLFFIELGVFFSILFARRQNTIYTIATGVSIGAAILCKWLPALIVIPIWLLIVIDSRKFSTKTVIAQLTLLIVVATTVFLPWQVYIYHSFPAEANWEGTYNFRHLFEPIENHDHPFYFYLNCIRISYGELIYLVLIYFIIKFIKQRQVLKPAAIAIWILAPLLFFSAAQTKMQGYILFISPALFIVTGDFFYSAANEIKGAPYLRIIRLLLLAVLIILPVRYCAERIKPLQKGRKPEWISALKKFDKSTNSKAILLNYRNNIAAMFYTRLTAYPSLIDKQKILALEKEGFTVYVNKRDTASGPAFDITEKTVLIHLPDPE